MKVTCEYKKDSRTLTLYLPDDVGEFLPEGSIGEGVLAPGSVNSDHLQDYIILAKHIVNEIITEEKIANFSISADKLADGSVTTDKIATKAITTIKLDDSCITSVQLQDGSIGQKKIQAGNALITIVSSLPALPNDDYPHGSTIFLTTDNKLYRSTGTTWEKNVDNTDITGQLTRDQLDVLARNRINNFLVESEGSTGWNLDFGCSIVEVDGFKAIKGEAQSGGWPNGIYFSSEYFFVDPNEILEFSFGLECPQYTEGGSGLYIGIGNFGTEYYKQYYWSFAEKKWEVFNESYNNCYFIRNYTSPVRRFFKTYILGSNVDIDKVPAPSFPDMEYNIFCMQLLPGAVSTMVRNGFNTPIPGDYWYFIAPQILVNGSFNIRASNILAESITAGQIATNAITSDKIDANAITSEKIESGAIVAAKLAAGSVVTEKLATGAILAAHIAAGAIEAQHIAAGTITADKFESTFFGDLDLVFSYVKQLMGNVDLDRLYFTLNQVLQGTLTDFSYTGSGEQYFLWLTPSRAWDGAYTWDGTSKWDASNKTSASILSAAYDTSNTTTKQLFLNAIKLFGKKPSAIKIEAIYSTDSTDWGTNFPDYDDDTWEEIQDTGAGMLLHATGSQGEWRYYKFKITFTFTSDYDYFGIVRLNTSVAKSRLPVLLTPNVTIDSKAFYSTSGTWQPRGSTSLSHYLQNTSNANGDYVLYKAGLLDGSYKLYFDYLEAATAGIVKIYVNDVLVLTQDCYAATNGAHKSALSDTFVVGSDQEVVIKVEVDGKNAGSNGYRANIFELVLIRQES